MTRYAHITKVFYRPSLSNDYKWKMREYAIMAGEDTNKAVLVLERSLPRKEVKSQMQKKPKSLKRGGFLGSMKNRSKLAKFSRATK